MSASDQATESTRLLDLLSEYLAIKPPPRHTEDDDEDDDNNQWEEEEEEEEEAKTNAIEVPRALGRLKTFLHDDSLPEDYVTLLQSLPGGLLDAKDKYRNWFWSAEDVLKYYASVEEDAAKEAVVEEEINCWLKNNYKYRLVRGFKCGGGIDAKTHVYYGRVEIKKDWYTSPANKWNDKEGITESEAPRWKLMVYYSGDEFAIYHSMAEVIEDMLERARGQE